MGFWCKGIFTLIVSFMSPNRKFKLAVGGTTGYVPIIVGMIWGVWFGIKLRSLL